jgi:hypothetical protein
MGLMGDYWTVEADAKYGCGQAHPGPGRTVIA